MDDLRILSERLPPLDELAPRWREFDLLGAHDFFATWTWIGTWLRTLPPSIEPTLLKAMKGGALVGLATLTFTRTKLHGLLPISQAWLNATGDPDLDGITIEHNGFASAHATSIDLLQALVKTFAEGRICSDELILPGVRGVDAPARGVLDAGRFVPAFRAPLTALDNCHGVEPLLSANARQQLRRSLREARRIGPISVEIARDLATALEFFAGLKTYHIRWWERRGRSHAFNNAVFENFHGALIPNGIRDQNIDLLRISAGDHVLGYMYNFRRNGKVSSYQTGFDDTLLNLRPGYVCHALAMSYYANAGMLYYDFLAGANRLKETFCPQYYQLGWHQFRKKTVIFQLEAIARRIRATLKNVRESS